jgi:adenine-specific DNA-methyltransferase
MIYPRLKLARNLLTNEGIIFISIDDNELNNLKKLCDEIFGEENFVSLFIWKSKSGGAGDSSRIAVDCEYILSYSKNINLVEINKEIKIKKFDHSDKFSDERGFFNKRNLDETGIRYSESLDFKIEKKNKHVYVDDEKISDSSLFYFDERMILKEFSLVPGGDKNHLKKYTWRWSKNKIVNGLKNGYLCFKTNNYGEIKLIQKSYEFFDTSREIKIANHYTPFRNLLTFTNTSQGTKDIKDLFDGIAYFDYPKPVNLLSHLLKIGSNKNDIILDFFSGSGTMAHAVMDLNSFDDYNRKFILVQISEEIDEKSNAFKSGYKSITEIGKERIRRAGEKIKSESNNKNLDIGFKVFKLDSSNLNKWNPDYNDLEQTLIDSTNNLVEGRTELDLVYEIMLKYGIDLTLAIEEYILDNKKVYSIGYGSLLICLDDNITKEIAIPLIELKNKLSPETIRVVFKDNGFASDSDKTNIKETLKTNNIDEFITI